MTPTLPQSERWAAFRFSVIGPLYAARPDHGELRPALEELSRQHFNHPITGKRVRFAYSTLERWFYRAVQNGDPLHELRRKVRKDAGAFKSVSLELRGAIRAQFREHPTWSYQLHYENLDAVVEKHPELGPLPSYTTVRRYMRAQGYVRQKRRTDHRVHHSAREVRSYEMADAHALWHLDFHTGKRRVLLPNGEYVKPHLLAILDDHSRVVCHAQWYLGETAEHLVHGLCQAFLKRGLPRAILMDNGAAMISAEVIQGLLRLGIVRKTTLPESPHQNGKQETFFAPVEGKCLAMLEGVPDLNLDLLNRATIAWVEQDYHRRHHEGIDAAPLDRLREAHSEARVSPSLDTLRAAFREELERRQRRGDGTISVHGVRFEVPSLYRHLEKVHVRVARWDLSRVTMVDPRHGNALAELHPLDRHRNADGHRKVVDPTQFIDEAPAESGMAPHLARLIEEAESTGLPAAYIPFQQDASAPETSNDD